MASGMAYTVDEARRLLPIVRATLLQLAVERRSSGDEATMQALVDHLASLGVVVRDLEAGLVDIPTIHQGERAWLCWRLDDPELGWWHTTREGFASRRRL